MRPVMKGVVLSIGLSFRISMMPYKVTSFIQYFGGDFFREKTMPSFSRLISAAPDSATICDLQTCSKRKIAY